MIIATPNKSYRTYTLRKYHKGRLIAKYRTEPITTKLFKQMRFFGTESWNNYIKTNSLKNIK